MSDSIVVRSFPSDDRDFATHVRAAAEALIGIPPDQLERCLRDLLRQTFPNVVVRRISELGADEPGRLTWYVFRHGRGIPPVSRGDPPVSRGDPPVSRGDPPPPVADRPIHQRRLPRD